MYWDQLISTQLDQWDRQTPVVLPIAATEQHGSHLPLATDRMIGEHFCARLNEEMPKEVLVLPSMAIGCSAHHLDFSGTLSLTHDTFLRHATDVLGCVVQHGFHKLVLFNSHGGNQGIGQVIVEQFGHRHPGCDLAFITWWRIALEELISLNETGFGGVGHAGEFETSLMLHIAPELVHMDAVGPPQNAPNVAWASGDLLRGPKVAWYKSMKALTPNGVFGDARSASAEKGAAISAAVVQRLKAILRDFAQA